jgi:hypothetical protein
MTRRSRGAVIALAVIEIVIVTIMAGCARPPAAPLPQAGSPAETLYVSRCSVCHSAYDPRSMTAAMWQIQVTAMESRIEHAGLPPLSPADRATILNYLTSNAGTE